MLLCSTFILYLDFIIKIFCDCDDFHATQISIILVISKGKMSILVLLYFIIKIFYNCDDYIHAIYETNRHLNL